MKCEICGEDIQRKCNFFDDELVCEYCGASYCLELLGAYTDENPHERIECGKEFEKWKLSHKSNNKREE